MNLGLYTTCTKCNTTYSITLDLIQKSKGRVQCSYCLNIFDAYTTLKTSIPNQDNTEQNLLSKKIEGNLRKLVKKDLSKDKEINKNKNEHEGLIQTKFKYKPKESSDFLSFINILLFLMLVTQIIFWNRYTLVEYFPQSTYIFNNVCKYLKCNIKLPFSKKNLQIESSELNLIESGEKNIFELNILLRNTSKMKITYPKIKTIFKYKKPSDSIIKIFVPEDYIEKKSNIRTGIDPNKEFEIRLLLNFTNEKIIAFEVSLYNNQDL